MRPVPSYTVIIGGRPPALAWRRVSPRFARTGMVPRSLAHWPISHGCLLADDWVTLKDRIKEASDIVEVVGGYLSLRQVGPTFKGLCPFHDDHKPSLDVDPRRQRYRCWSCNQYGDVIKFVQEYEHVEFREALELLARRAGIPLEKFKNSPQGPSRASMLELMRWAGEQFAACLVDSPLAESARVYLGTRRLTGETVRRFGLGFAPPAGEWLVQRAANDGLSPNLLETLGLIARRDEGRGYYDRFRDRVMFPIRDLRGQTVGFGGRILPSSPLSAKGPKYYNSAETPLFAKSDHLYGIDQARPAALKVGYIAVVEGYTDVLMAHQHGIGQVVATMGTALNARHVNKLKGAAPRVVLVFDADQGGDSGVDRALEVFVSHDLDLRVATLPSGLDPCDLLSAQGPAPFVEALEKAVDVFEYKLNRVWNAHASQGLEGMRRATEEMIKTLANSPRDRSVKLELMVNRVAHRLRIKEETLWLRLQEVRESRRGDGPEAVQPRRRQPVPEEPRTARAARHEVELLEVLLAEPSLIDSARSRLECADLEHPGLRLLLECLYDLQAQGLPADLDHLRDRVDNDRLVDQALLLQDRGLGHADRPEALERVLARFQEKREAGRRLELKNQVVAAQGHDQAIAILRRLQNPTVHEPANGTSKGPAPAEDYFPPRAEFEVFPDGGFDGTEA